MSEPEHHTLNPSPDEDLSSRITGSLKSTLESFEERQKEINKRSGRNLLVAIAIGLLLGLSFLASLFFIEELFIVFLVAAAGVGTYEFATALRHVHRDIPRFASVIGVSAQIVCAYYWGSQGLLWSLGTALFFVGSWRLLELIRKDHRTGIRNVFLDLGIGNFLQIYIGFLLSFCALLLREDRGEWWILSFVIIVVVIDTSALGFGVLFGKHKFVPKISPSKTWEGFLGGALSACITGVLSAIFILDRPFLHGLILALALVFTATIGDLIESMMKRDLGVKDMSTLLPGHGGIMDRLDSMLPSCLAAFVVFQALAVS